MRAILTDKEKKNQPLFFGLGVYPDLKQVLEYCICNLHFHFIFSSKFVFKSADLQVHCWPGSTVASTSHISGMPNVFNS